MSRTYGHTKAQSEHKFPYENRMPPYLADKNRGDLEFVVEHGRGTGISKTGKLITKNANRSRKKAMRQQSKRLIEQELD